MSLRHGLEPGLDAVSGPATGEQPAAHAAARVLWTEDVAGYVRARGLVPDDVAAQARELDRDRSEPRDDRVRLPSLRPPAPAPPRYQSPSSRCR